MRCIGARARAAARKGESLPPPHIFSSLPPRGGPTEQRAREREEKLKTREGRPREREDRRIYQIITTILQRPWYIGKRKELGVDFWLGASRSLSLPLSCAPALHRRLLRACVRIRVWMQQQLPATPCKSSALKIKGEVEEEQRGPLPPFVRVV